MQFPFPSLSYPIAHDNWTFCGIHPPAPSETKPSKHEATGNVNGVIGEVEVGRIGTQLPYVSVSYPYWHVTWTDTGMQFPAPSLVCPDGHGLGRGVESETQFPFPSLLYPVAHTAGIDDATQFPSPSDLKPDGQTSKTGEAEEAGVRGIVIGMHPPWLSVSNPDAHEVKVVS